MADRIVGEYDIKVNDAIKQLDKLAGRVSNLEKQSKKSAQGTEDAYSKMATNLTAQFKNVAGALGIAFGAQQVIQLGKEMVTLAAQAEGVERAFKRVGSPQLLADLRKATRGTVSDLQLMQNAVKASNFKIPLENLASLFKFAQARARETGESVDYLVDSIILGIGRKSPLILDNLGISAVELRARLKGVGVEAAEIGDVAQIIGDIATEELAKMGDQADTTADKIGRITTAFENAKVEGGEFLIQLGDIVLMMDDFTDVVNRGSNGYENYAKRAAEAGKALKELSLARGEDIGIIERYRVLLFGLNEEQQEEIKLSRESKEIREDQYITVEQLLGLYDDLDAAQSQEIRNVFFLQNEIKKLKDEREREGTTVARVLEIKEQLIPLEEELALLLGKETEATKKLREEREKLAKLLIADMDDPFAGAPTIAEATGEVDLLGNALNEAFGTEGTDRINAFWDEFMRSALEALDEVDAANAQSYADRLNVANAYVDSISSIYDSISQITANAYQREYQELETQLEQGLISREQYEAELANIKRREAAANKDAAIFQATISTAQAVVNALGSFPFSPANIAIAAAIGAAGAAQIAAIASQPLPQFAEGGFVNEHGEIKGRKHKHGGVLIEAEGGEFITSAKYARQNSAILKAINTGDWERYKVENIIAPAIEQAMSGGFEGMGASYQIQQMFNDKNILKAEDRHRQSNKEGFMYLGKKIDSLNRRASRWN